jgi:protein tyrosine phosphatase
MIPRIYESDYLSAQRKAQEVLDKNWDCFHNHPWLKIAVVTVEGKSRHYQHNDCTRYNPLDVAELMFELKGTPNYCEKKYKYEYKLKTEMILTPDII